MAKLTNPYKGKCPECTDGLLVERTNSKINKTFLGCSEWPLCNFTKRGGKHPAPKVEPRIFPEFDYYYEDEYEMDLYDYF